MPLVFVIGRDWALRAGVRAELRERHIEALGMETVEDAGKLIADGQVPSLIVAEANSTVPSPALSSLAKRIPVIVVASRSQRIQPLPNAAIVLHRPVRVSDVVASVEKLLRGEAA